MNNFNDENDNKKHICQLKRTSGSTLPHLPPNANTLLNLKRRFQKLIIISENHPYTNYYLRSGTGIMFEKRRHQSGTWWIIHPYSRLRFFWNNLMTVNFLYFFIIVPYIISFYTICGKKIVYQFNLIIPTYAICIVDIVMNFITGYMLIDGSGIILQPSLIARHYTQTFFLIDLITSIPYGLIIQFGEAIPSRAKANFIVIIAELIPLLKIIRLSTLRYYIKQINITYGLFNVADIMMWLSVLTILIFHWSACLTWSYPFLAIHATRTPYKYSDIYVLRTGIFYEDALRIYIMSLHMGISNLVGSTFIEFQETTSSEKWIRCLLLIFGTGYFIYLIVVVMQLVESSAEPEIKYEKLMKRVKEYMNERNVSSDIAKKIISYYEYRFQGNFFQENIVVSIFPNHLRREMNLYSNCGLWQTASIFRYLPGYLVTNIINISKPIIHLQNDVIYEFGDIGNYMYFIITGTVAIVNAGGKEIVHLEDGDYFGEMCIIQRNLRRQVSALAVETTELIRLDYRQFNRLIPPNSELFQRFITMMKERLVQMDKVNKISLIDKRQYQRRNSKYKRLLMRTGDLTPSFFNLINN